MPEDCSRLIQARSTVHFNLLCDHFAPFDTAFSIADATELRDTKLSAACSLHASSASTGSNSSSTSSLRRRRLMEIAEEDEEEHREKKRQSVSKEEEILGTSAPGDNPASSVLAPGRPPSVTLNSELAASPEESQFAGTVEPPPFIGAPRPASPSKSFDDAARRNSSQSARYEAYSSSSYYSYKPKVKLGPRPSLEAGGRPRTSGSADNQRPVSSIPAGFKLSWKGSKSSHSQDKIILEEGEIGSIKEKIQEEEPKPSDETSSTPASTHLSESLDSRPVAGDDIKPAVSSAASLKSSLPIMDAPSAKPSFISPEKARLMKAMKLREEKKKLLSAQSVPSTQDSGLSLAGLPTPDLDHESTSHAGAEQEPQLAAGQDEAESVTITDPEFAVGSPVDTLDLTSFDAQTDSHPTSPVASSSDVGAQSTKASSLSESTNETILLDQNQACRREMSGENIEENTFDYDPATGTESGNRVQTTIQIGSHVPNIAQDQAQTSNPIVDHGVIDEASKLDDTKSGGLPVAGITEVSDGSCDENPVSPLSSSASCAATQSSEGHIIADAEALPSSAPSGDVEPVGTQQDAATTTATLPSPGVISTPDSLGCTIPLSKFSTQESRSPTTSTQPFVPQIVTRAPDAQEYYSHRESTVAHTSRPELGEIIERTSEETARPKLRVAPIRTDLELPDTERFQGESDISDDEDLMEELQSATLQQARPMTFSKSPVAPAFPVMSPKKPKPGSSNGNGSVPALSPGRAASNPVHGSLLVPSERPGSSRTVSSGAASYLHKITQQQAVADLKPKTGKIGSSISQRIKALQEQTSSTGGGDVVTKERPSSTFFSVRKGSIREPSRSQSVRERAASALKGVAPSPPDSREPSPETGRLLASRDRSGSMANRLSMFEPLAAVPPSRGRTESIQVKARIIRDPVQPLVSKMSEHRADTGEFSHVDFKQSPLVVNMHDTTSSPEPVFGESSAETLPEGRQSLLQRRWSKGRMEDHSYKDEFENTREPTARPRRRSSLTVVKDFIKDTRDALSGRSPSSDNISMLSPQSTGNLASPPAGTPSSRSPSRPPSSHHNPLFPRRLSINSRRSSIDRQAPHSSHGGLSPSLMTEAGSEMDPACTSASGSDLVSRPDSNGSATALSPGPKNPNRATRFMRRLSNTIVSTTRKNGVAPSTPTVTEENDIQVAPHARQQVITATDTTVASNTQPTIATFMGDVNVQFPDTLLWKRRTMCLDNQGFLILSAVQGVTSAKQMAGAMKRYHMSQFRQPYLPDMDVQELPNSIVLDFMDGSGIQLACEDRAGQLNTLHMLQTAHQTHNSFSV
ncbi:hypothetical protein DL546_008815 [Coniochaeta pulveracea]|nr:hypothetical protein DL546_008815 [Coniochaeta pulveracea]